jgi:hypothetical protein
MLRIKLFIVVLCSLLHIQLFAQDIDARLGVDSNEVSIGDYIHLTASITYPTDQYSIIFPNINDLYITPFTIIAQSAIDTSQSARTTTLQQTTTIACYDSGLYQLPKLHINGFNTDNDSAIDISTDSLYIKVNAVPVNINGDIKDIFVPKQSTQYWIPITIALSVFTVLFFTIYFAVKYLARYKKRATPLIDPFKKTMETLHNLQQTSITNQEQAKQYYSTITDVCKYYLHTRLHVPVLDKTTIQISEVLKSNLATASIAANITNVFQLADLVKFAKQSTTSVQNADALQQSITVIQTLEQHYQTKLLQQAATPNE